MAAALENQDNKQVCCEQHFTGKLEMENVPIPKTLDELVEHLHRVFAADTFDIEYVKQLLCNYKSEPKQWSKYVTYDPSK